MGKAWTTKPLGEVCKTAAGGTPLKSVKEYYEGGDIPWLLSGEVSQGGITEATNFITEKGLANSSARLFPPNTVLVAMYGATAGQVGILRFEASTNQAVCGILPGEHFLPEFLYYYFLHKKGELVAQTAGNAQPNISQIKIKNTGVPVAPLPEQHHIVAILDEAFDGIATAKANAEQNLQNARALFESHLQAVFTERGEGWVTRRVSEVAKHSLGKMLDKAKNKGEPQPYLRNLNVRWFEFDLSDLLEMPFLPTEVEKYTAVKGDVLICEGGYAYFGAPVFVYSLRDGINDGFLTPFRVKQIATTLDDYVFTPDDTVVEGEIEAGKRYEEADFNRIIEIREREKRRVEIFMGQIDPREKTLVFCANQTHALVIRDLINQIKTSSDPDYCQRVTADDGALGEQWLRDFQDNEKTIPTILTTSQKLSTGVDARNVRNIVLLRPINSMIEFKQIIGRGTRLYDGKDYFTIYDFVRAHHHFSDPEWDGEPIAPDAPYPPSTPHEPLEVREPRPNDTTPRQAIKVKLADGKARTIQHMMATSFWHPDGTPMSAAQFMEALFGKLPEFFRDEDELRTLWSAPDTRRKLLEGLAEKGFGKDQLAEMQKLIDAENSDLFDVLAHVAYALAPLTREERAARAEAALIGRHFSDRQRAFLDFVLSHYVSIGVEELDQAKLTPLLKLKYHDSIADAVADLGKPEEIGRVFAGFQKYLYLTDTLA